MAEFPTFYLYSICKEERFFPGTATLPNRLMRVFFLETLILASTCLGWILIYQDNFRFLLPLGWLFAKVAVLRQKVYEGNFLWYYWNTKRMSIIQPCARDTAASRCKCLNSWKPWNVAPLDVCHRNKDLSFVGISWVANSSQTESDRFFLKFFKIVKIGRSSPSILHFWAEPILVKIKSERKSLRNPPFIKHL